MELDKRIKSINDIQTVVSSNKKFIGKMGYLAENIGKFKDLSKCAYGEISVYREDDKCFCCLRKFTSGIHTTWYPYFISEDDLLPKEPEKKYRAYTLKEFIGDMNLGLGPWIRMRPVGTNKECKFLYTGYRETEVGEYICLGCYQFDFISLFKNYEIYINGEWQPFGVIEEDKE